MKETKLLCMLMALLLSVLCAVPAQARWYGAEEGRFISVAPYAPNIEHPYVFCENNPINKIDPSGEHTIDDCECEFEQCNETCRNIRRGSQGYSAKARRAICYSGCMAKYAACLASAEETLKVVGAVVVIAGVTYIVVQTGGGALILVPAL